MRTARRFAHALGLTALICGSLGARADAHPLHWGMRGGITDDRDSLFFGLHLSAGGRVGLRIEPSLDFGLGDLDYLHYWTLRVNGNVKYLVGVGPDRDQALFALTGVALYHAGFDDSCRGCDETVFGVNVGAGMEILHYLVEVVFGVGIGREIPMITMTFGRHL